LKRMHPVTGILDHLFFSHSQKYWRDSMLPFDSEQTWLAQKKPWYNLTCSWHICCFYSCTCLDSSSDKQKRSCWKAINWYFFHLTNFIKMIKERKTAASLSNNLEYGQLNITINHSLKCQLCTNSSIHFTIINYCSRICCECSCINIPDFVKEKQDLSCQFFKNKQTTYYSKRKVF